MATKLILPGRALGPTDTPEPDHEVAEFLDVQVLRTHTVDATQRGGPVDESGLPEAEDTDIIEMDWGNGVKQWVSVEQLRHDQGQMTERDGSGAQELRVPLRPYFEQPSRSAADWFLKGLKILRIDPTAAVAGLAAAEVMRLIEDRLKPEAGLYFLPDPTHMGERVDSADQLDSNAPYLLFIHGTASATSLGFGGLAGDNWTPFRERYGNRILALEHRTLSVSPIQNAIDVLERLPPGAKLHLVTHSRGGLVGELLCLRPLEKAEIQPFVNAERPDAKLLGDLSDLLKAKDLQVERFVRTACPARGTILAEGRLDRWFSIMLSLLGMIPVLRASPAYAFTKAVLLQMIQLRAEPNQVPGIEAQIPGSAVINLLNRPGVLTKADLAVVAGDLEADSIWGRLKFMATDLFYREDHDLVVNTQSMYGGIGREQKSYRLFDQGTGVNHFSYFSNDKTRAAVVSWLTRAPDAPATPFEEMQAEPAVTLSNRARAVPGAAELPAVFLLPGLMGTHLTITKETTGGADVAQDERIWLDFQALSLGKIRQLSFAASDNVAVDEIMTGAYLRLSEYLQSRYEVIPFPYDWRRSCEVTGAQLAAAVRAQLNKHRRPIRFLAHSASGLVVRAMMMQDPELWKMVCERDGRVVMLGTPNAGTFVIPRLLLGRARLLRLLTLLDFQHSEKELVDIMRQYPGLLEMMPVHGGIDFFSATAWRSLTELPADESAARRKLIELPAPEAGALQAAQQVRARLAAAIDPQHMLYVAGSAPSTPCGLRRQKDGIAFDTTPLGDGCVTYAQGELEGVSTWYMDAQHGDLANHAPAFPALIDLLDKGETKEPGLWQELPPAVTTARSSPIRLDKEPLLFPTEAELMAAALGRQVEKPPEKETHAIKMSVVHSHLRQAKYPIAVGHYHQDTMVGAEAEIDNKLDGRLGELFRMDLYPGPVGTAEVIHAPGHQPPGALVIGLGEVGGITAEKVRQGVATAALRHALAVAQAQREKAQREKVEPIAEEDSFNPDGIAHPNQCGWQSAAFSTLLLGTTGGNALSTESSVTAIVQGAIQANHALRAQDLWDWVRVDEVEIVEMYEDVATDAVRVASNLKDHPPRELAPDETLEVVPLHLRALDGGRFQRPTIHYDGGWWRRIQVTSEPPPGATSSDKNKPKESVEPSSRNLEFLSLTDRARAEATLESTQRKLIDKFIAKAVQSSHYDENLASTLFELLVPNELKDRVSMRADLVMVVDEVAAQYPWELMAQRTQDKCEPLVLNMGFIRQFKTERYRNNPQPARGLEALVIGDTKIGEVKLDGTTMQMPDLPGAQAEARAVQATLEEAGYKVKGLIKQDALTVVGGLFEKEYKILHLAGHGDYKADDPTQSGMMLGDDMYLTTAEIKKLRVVPELVFINCCHLGRIDNEPKVAAHAPHLLAASIAEELINMGVKAVVAAGWAVDDAAAATFAATFYQEMLRGQSFGRAVRTAREKVYQDHDNTNTWGAYQCYGNPDFKLEKNSGTEGSSRIYYSRREYRDQLRDIAVDARASGFQRSDTLLKQLNSLRKSIPFYWMDGEILATFGAAYGELGVFDKAVEHYQKAIEAPGGGAPLSTVEKFVELLARHAVAQHEAQAAQAAAPPAAAAEAAAPRESHRAQEINKTVEEAVKWLGWLLQLGETAERYTLLGDNYYRLALATKNGQRKEMLQQARNYFGKASELLADASGGKEPGITLKWILCRVLLRDTKTAQLLAMIDECKVAGKEKSGQNRSFESLMIEPTIRLLEQLVQGDLNNSHQTEIAKMYNRAVNASTETIDSTASLNNAAAVREWFNSMICILNDKPYSAKRAAIVTALRSIEAAIRVVGR